MKKRKVMKLLFSLAMSASLLGTMYTPVLTTHAAGNDTIVINEINSAPDDWIEIMNCGAESLDISGYEIRDNSDDHRWKFADGTILEAGGLFLVKSSAIDGTDGKMYNDTTMEYEDGKFDIGLGSGDSVRLYNNIGEKIDEYSWTSHASYGGQDSAASYGRYPDGTGEFVLTKETPNAPNECHTLDSTINPVVLNEVQSNDPNKGPDWIELANPTGKELDISGLEIKDDDDSHSYIIPEGTKIPANGFLVLDDTQFGFGLGKGDSVRIFQEISGEKRLIQSTTWPAGSHTSPTWGLYPDVNGSEYRNTEVETPGSANKFTDTPNMPDTKNWNRGDERTDIVKDSNLTFLEDSSGLDFHNGQLYAVDNGTATFWILDAAKDGSLSFADGFENGKAVAFQKDADNLKAAGPDTEGISVDNDGFVYLASERDNSAKGVNYNTILKVDPKTPGNRIVASQQWDLTDLLPNVAANMGIEAVEWVANSDVDGKLFDQNTNAPYDHSKYPNASANGIFFVALEDNGHVYAFVLNNDSTATLIADIDSCLGGAMALDYDTYEKILRVASDNGYNNKLAEITLNGTNQADIVHVAAPAGLNVQNNYEGFAIADASYTQDGMRPVYRFLDGVKDGSLCLGSIVCDYTAASEKPDDPEKPETPEDSEKPGTGDSDNSGNHGNTGSQNNTEIQNNHNSQSNHSASSAPKTGDSQNALTYLFLSLLSLCTFAFVIVRKSRIRY